VSYIYKRIIDTLLRDELLSVTYIAEYIDRVGGVNLMTSAVVVICLSSSISSITMTRSLTWLAVIGITSLISRGQYPRRTISVSTRGAIRV